MKSKKNIKSILIIAIIGIFSLVFFNKSFAANTAKVTVETANIRKEANSTSNILEQVSQNQEVEIIEKSGDWYKIKYKGIANMIAVMLGLLFPFGTFIIGVFGGFKIDKIKINEKK